MAAGVAQGEIRRSGSTAVRRQSVQVGRRRAPSSSRRAVTTTVPGAKRPPAGTSPRRHGVPRTRMSSRQTGPGQRDPRQGLGRRCPTSDPRPPSARSPGVRTSNGSGLRPLGRILPRGRRRRTIGPDARRRRVSRSRRSAAPALSPSRAAQGPRPCRAAPSHDRAVPCGESRNRRGERAARACFGPGAADRRAAQF